ncbi:MAG: ATP-binding protein [Spartobacteria bacterium]|nr:ATP-binding protein [Spartobacteria bacterium]
MANQKLEASATNPRCPPACPVFILYQIMERFIYKDMKTKRFFTMAGPCVEGKHYMLSPAARCGDIFTLIEHEMYFAIHAARQTGKTTMLISLTKELQASGDYHALYVSLESCQGFDDPREGLPAVTRAISSAWQRNVLLRDLVAIQIDRYADDLTNMVSRLIGDLALALDKPLVLFFDEVDCLADGTLISFLRQIREGYINRAFSPFAHSLALVGMRDVRDYKVQLRDGRSTLGSASPFNIKTKSLTLRGFTRDEIAELYAQHTDETGQVFPAEVTDWVFEQTQGQPWLVNAVAREMVMELSDNDPSRELTLAMAKQAVKNIILRRETHIDSLLERLKEPRVRKVIEAMMLGENRTVDPMSDDVAFVTDMGLCRYENNRLCPANPIYAEVIGRTLSWHTQFYMGEADLPYVLQRYGTPESGLDMMHLMNDFQQFWRENSDVWIEKYEYKEAAPHLVLMAFLQRIINGGGHIVREFATGRKRMDLIVELGEFRYPVEIKLWRGPKTVDEGQAQLDGYLDTQGLSEGWLVIFDRRPNVPWDEKISQREITTQAGRTIHLFAM